MEPTKKHVDEKTAQWAEEVAEGLRANPKYISSKFFYDARGDKLFQNIMNMPEYYPSNCEFEIFEESREKLKSYLPPQPFDLVELGAGDGRKTSILLKYFLKQGVDFKYFPIDISGAVLEHLSQTLQREIPQLSFETMTYEYFEALEKLNEMDENPRLVLFLGGNVGNFTHERAEDFFRHLHQILRRGDLLLSGIDLRKNPETILKAYNDDSGITREFNLNLLDRFNREFGADFHRDNFQHYPTYDPVSGEARSYLMSTCDQEIHFAKTGHKIDLSANEPIHTEISRKYSFAEIEGLAGASNFEVLHHFTDHRDWFTDTLWQKR